jgi:ABC-type multidrug transport system permease subunit
MPFLWTAVRKDLGRLRRDPISVATSLGIPLILVTLVTLVFGGGGQGTPQGRLLVADEDGTFLSQALTGAFSRDPLSKMFVLETTAREEGRRRMDHGDASALLIVPKGFQDAVFQSHPAQLQLVTNPAQSILPNIAEETLSVMVDGGFYLQRLAGNPLSSFTTGQRPSDATIVQASLAFSSLGQSLSKYLDPALIKLELNVTADKRESQNVGAIFLPTMLFMGLLFVGNSFALDIWKEQAWGTLRRLATTPVSLGAFLGGRLISLVLVLCTVALLGVGGMRWLADVPVASVPLATIWLTLSGLAFYLFLLTIAVHASGQRTANVVGNLVVFPLALIGGSFFPFEMMPDWMASIGRFTPNGWAITLFKEFVGGTAHALDLVIGAGWMAAVGSLFFLITVRRLRRLV